MRVIVSTVDNEAIHNNFHRDRCVKVFGEISKFSLWMNNSILPCQFADTATKVDAAPTTRVNIQSARDVPTATTGTGLTRGIRAVIMTTTTDTNTAAVGTGNSSPQNALAQ